MEAVSLRSKSVICYVFSPHYAQKKKKLKTQQLLIIFDLRLSKKTRSEKLSDYREAIVFEKLRFQISKVT